MFDLSEKVAIIFGGSDILGSQFVKTLIEYNATVISCDIIIPEEKLDTVEYLKINALEKEELDNLSAAIVKKHGSIDILINSVTAKGNDFYLPFEDVSLEGWNIGLAGNLTIPFLTCQCFIKQMKKQQSGSIINISSIYGIVGNDQRIYEGSNLHEIYVDKHPNIKQIYSHGVYNASKGGLNNFTRYLAAYYGKDNIRVNCITPGGIEYPSENETFVEKYSNKVPLHRKAKRHEMNGALIYLASDASTYVTGHNLIVDGGYSCW
ncbi:MAG: SDR family oxidoreductase [Oceanihabitans sp.]